MRDDDAVVSTQEAVHNKYQVSANKLAAYRNFDYSSYKPLPIAHDGFIFKICCGLFYAECERKDTYGYFYQRADHSTLSEGWDGESTMCDLYGIRTVLAFLGILELSCGHTDVRYLQAELHKVSEDTVDATKMVESETRTRAGILCCCGPSSVQNTHAFFSHTTDKKPGVGVMLPNNTTHESVIVDIMK